MIEEKGSDIHLRPRFRIEFNENQELILEKFKESLKNGDCKYKSRIVDEHIVIDIPQEESHFWSPQLNVEVEMIDKKKSIVKGLFGPKPQVWTLFMFIHFGVAIAFLGFLISWYVKWSLKENTTLPLAMVVFLPVLWILLYFLGRIGKEAGHKQIEELHEFLIKTLDRK